MEQPFDPTLKTLSELAPADWLPLAGRRRRRTSIVDSDIGTLVSGATDKLLRVHDSPEYLLHLDFEAGHFRSDLLGRLHLYNTVFAYRHRCVVLSAAVLLSPAADSPRWDGVLRSGFPGEEPLNTFRYTVIRVWQLPVEQLLAGGMGTLALAPISDVAEHEVRQVIRRMQTRLTEARARRRAAEVWAATYVLLGLRYSDTVAHALFQKVLGMEESATYRAIVRKGKEQGRVEGRVEGERRVLLLVGERTLGTPDAETRAALERIDDAARLEELAARLTSVSSWQELLQTSAARRRGRRR